VADVDAVVIGAGVIGLAIARRLALCGLETLILEAEPTFGNGTSSRNSEVIHAGLHYPGLPLKAAYCVEGNRRLYRYCADRGIPHRRLGKLIVAFSAHEEGALEAIQSNAKAAGVDDLLWLSGREVRGVEPALDCTAAILSPSTGIIDSHAYMLALLADAEAAGATLVKRTLVTRLTRAAGGDWQLHIEGETVPVLSTRIVVNAAGHGACSLAAATEGLEARLVPTAYYARGTYFTYQGVVPFTRLIYPVPVAGGLGTHLTLDLSGAARFGPDVEWIEDLDYSLDANRIDHFKAAAMRIWPELDGNRLQPGYCGVRPKLGGKSEPASDFMIQGPSSHGLAGLVGLYGIESPGLTASLVIADEVGAQLGVRC
jgi:L-2-hydroxyglutarate oxidase LhgO